MFDHLVESRPHRERTMAQAIASIVVHTALIAASIQLTRAVAAPAPRALPERDMLLTGPPVPRATEPRAVAASPAAAPAPHAFTITPPLAIPAGTPPVQLVSGFDATRLNAGDSGAGGATGTAHDVGSGDPPAILDAASVDQPAEYVDGPPPLFPPALKQVGIEGWVELRYVVGIDGRAETGSITVIRSSNRSFEAPAIDAIRGARFRPARIRGRVVRQLVEQAVRFTLR